MLNLFVIRYRKRNEYRQRKINICQKVTFKKFDKRIIIEIEIEKMNKNLLTT